MPRADSRGWYETPDTRVGPGPSYFLAIPTIGIRYGSVAFVRWVVRPLSEARMRGALHGDVPATKLAFGEAFDA